MVRTGDPDAHISAIIRSLCIKLGHFAVDDDESMTAEDLAKRQTRWELGSAFEEAVRHGLARRYAADQPDRYMVPGELERDGLIGSPDLADLHDRAIIEVKLTWLSSRHEAEGEKFWKYWVQVKAYCHMMGWQVGRVHVAHVMGNYKDDRGPIYNVWEDTFTDRELQENWRMLTSHNAWMRKTANAKPDPRK